MDLRICLYAQYVLKNFNRIKTLLTIEEQKIMCHQSLKNIPKIGGNVEVKHIKYFYSFCKIIILNLKRI